MREPGARLWSSCARTLDLPTTGAEGGEKFLYAHVWCSFPERAKWISEVKSIPKPPRRRLALFTDSSRVLVQREDISAQVFLTYGALNLSIAFEMHAPCSRTHVCASQVLIRCHCRQLPGRGSPAPGMGLRPRSPAVTGLDI